MTRGCPVCNRIAINGQICNHDKRNVSDSLMEEMYNAERLPLKLSFEEAAGCFIKGIKEGAYRNSLKEWRNFLETIT